MLDRGNKNPQKRQEVEGDIHWQKMRMNRISISGRDEDTGMREDERKLEMVQTKRRLPKPLLRIVTGNPFITSH